MRISSAVTMREMRRDNAGGGVTADTKTVPSRSPPPPEIVTAQLRASGIMQTSAELHPLNEE